MVDTNPVLGQNKDFRTLTAVRNHQYAVKQGYDFKYLHFNATVIDDNAHCLNHEGFAMAAPWCKLLAVFYALDTYQPSRLVLLDSDAAFSPAAGPIDIQPATRDVVVSFNSDWPEAPDLINTGVQFWYNRGYATIKALYEWLSVSSQSRTRLVHPYEQRTLQHMMAGGLAPWAELSRHYPPFSNYYHNVSREHPDFERVLTREYDAAINSTLIRHYWSPIRPVRALWLQQLHQQAGTDMETEFNAMVKDGSIKTVSNAEVNKLGLQLLAAVQKAQV